MTTIGDMIEIVEEYFDMAGNLEDVMSSIGGYGTLGNNTIAELEESRGRSGSTQNEFLEIYDYITGDFLSSDIDTMLEAINSDDIEDVFNPRSWKEYATRRLTKLRDIMIPAFIDKIESHWQLDLMLDKC